MHSFDEINKIAEAIFLSCIQSALFVAQLPCVAISKQAVGGRGELLHRINATEDHLNRPLIITLRCSLSAVIPVSNQIKLRQSPLPPLRRIALWVDYADICAGLINGHVN